MGAGGGAAERVIAERAAADGDEPGCGSADRDAAGGGSADCQQDADGGAAEGNEADCQAADGEKSARQSAAGDPAGGDVAQREDAASVTAHLPTLPVGADRDCPERQAEDLARGFATDSPQPRRWSLSRAQQAVFGFGELLRGQRTVGAKPGEAFKFLGDVHVARTS